MDRILIFGMTENPGGVESFLLNYYRHIQKENIQFDFLCNTAQPVAYEDELLTMGARSFHISPRNRHPLRFRRELNRLFREHGQEWAGIWVNVCSLANIDYLKEARKAGIGRRIIHSHSSANMDGFLRGILHKVNRRRIGYYATDFWACSEEATCWFYPEKLMNRVLIIHNAIDTVKMRFDAVERDCIRKQYGWENKQVIGHIGRLHYEKNQTFLIELFEQYHTDHPDSVLVLIGQGEDESELKRITESKGLSDSIRFMGARTDIDAWLSSFDLFVFPSLFEGLSVSLLEAQANGIPILASEGLLPTELKVNSNFVTMKLDSGVDCWSCEADRLIRRGRVSDADAGERLASAGYDINREAGKLEQSLLGMNDQK